MTDHYPHGIEALRDRVGVGVAEARWWCRVFLDPFDPAGKHC